MAIALLLLVFSRSKYWTRFKLTVGFHEKSANQHCPWALFPGEHSFMSVLMSMAIHSIIIELL